MSNFLTVKQFAAKHPAFSEASLRYHIFHEEKNGLNLALKRVGRKILIQEDAFFVWIDSLQGNSNSGKNNV